MITEPKASEVVARKSVLLISTEQTSSNKELEIDTVEKVLTRLVRAQRSDWNGW